VTVGITNVKYKSKFPNMDYKDIRIRKFHITFNALTQNSIKCKSKFSEKIKDLGVRIIIHFCTGSDVLNFSYGNNLITRLATVKYPY
jgi:hypothetical protein